MGAGAGVHPRDGKAPFKIHHLIAFKHQFNTGHPPPAAYPRLQGYWGNQARIRYLYPRYLYQNLKSLRIWPTIFRGWPNFSLKNPTSILRGSTVGLNWPFTGKIPQWISGFKIVVGKVSHFPQWWIRPCPPLGEILYPPLSTCIGSTPGGFGYSWLGARDSGLAHHGSVRGSRSGSSWLRAWASGSACHGSATGSRPGSSQSGLDSVSARR